MNSTKEPLLAGLGRAAITPPLGTPISGYYISRHAEGVLDELEAVALALACNGKMALIIVTDLLGIEQDFSLAIREKVAAATGVSADAIFLSATHTHTGPAFDKDRNAEAASSESYMPFLAERITEAALSAIADLAPARMGFGVGEAPRVSFIRRFRMRDGNVRTNPGVNNPDIVAPIGDVDERVSVLRFDREGADTLLFVNFANHPDVVGGQKISGDWPALLRRTVERAIPNTRCLFMNGAQGDVNHVNVFPREGDLNGMFLDFDDVARGYCHSQHIANVVAGGVLQCYEKVQYAEVTSLSFRQNVISLPSQMPAPEDIPEAVRINDLHLAGRDSELPYEGMMLTTLVAEAARMVALRNGPETFTMRLSGIAIGPVALIGLPGEAFTGIGRGIKEAGSFPFIIPCGLTNGYQGYFPMKDAYDEGGYEAKSSKFRVGVAESMIEEAKMLLNQLENS